MFDAHPASREAGLGHSIEEEDFEAALESTSLKPVDASDMAYELHVKQVAAIDSAMARFNLHRLELIDRLVEADRDMVWAEDGSPSLAEWLTSRFRLTSFTGRTLARVARNLPCLPNIRRAFAEGRLSWDQLRALVDVATPETDAALAGSAPALTPSQIRATARKVDEREVADAWEDRSVTYRFREDEPIFEMNVRLPDEEGAALVTALCRKAGQIDVDPHDGSVAPYGARLADALVQIASQALASDADHDRATLLISTDIPTILGVEGARQAKLGDGTSIPRGTTITNATLRRLACDARIQLVIEDPVDGVIGIGRTSRTIPGWLARIVRLRDGGCRFPECQRTLWLQVHHLIHWADGGPTDLANLITLCGFHHRLIHNRGWSIEGNPNGPVTWITRWGTKFERHPPFPGIESLRKIHANPPPIEPPLRRSA